MSDHFTFATGANANYIDALFEQYQTDPSSVEETWRKFFDGYEFALSGSRGSINADESHDNAKVEAFINAYRRLGHLSASLNPLANQPEISQDLSPAKHGLGHIAGQRKFHPANFDKDASLTFDEIVAKLQGTYCGHVGADFREINNIEIVTWLQERMESCNNKPTLSNGQKRRILQKLSRAEGFERFLQLRYLGQKRFSLEGLDVVIPMLDMIIDEAAVMEAEELCLGMAHRGRLNVLANIMEKPYDKMLAEFEGSEFNLFDIDGDVKYHMGYANEVDTISGKRMRLHLSPNPSHLEAVNPVVEGFSRCRQRILKDSSRRKVIPILLHGDASFIGQGIVSETLNLCGLSPYDTGGTIHIITNNQIGFTTNYWESRSCNYSSDIAKVVRAPVLHVNADDPEACIWVAQLAVDYRQKFQKDIVIDVVGYRRHGHNEGDEPGYTQPKMYKQIANHVTVVKQYSDQLVALGDVSPAEVKAYENEVKAELQEAYERIHGKDIKIKARPVPKALEKSVHYVRATREEIIAPVRTGWPLQKLIALGKRFLSLPRSFNPHPKIAKLFETRLQMFDEGGQIDWSTAELLAFATMAHEGHHVRLSGQDCKRGTFSSRHGVLFDFETEEPLEILNIAGSDQADVNIINSPLSELGCLGFEFGYSVADPSALVLWEAQFGDFSNGAQIIIDQFIAASEAKWSQASSLVMLLPHGYEGQGPEHSSGRPERYLQLCGNLNMQVVNVTSPSQYFHLLRRQVKRGFRKPLIVMSPKSLLRHPMVLSNHQEFAEGTAFQEVIADSMVEDNANVETLLVCSGKIYYELVERTRQEGVPRRPIVRFEQLYPFPWERFREILSYYPKLKDVVWVQEEPQNMGAWSYIRPRLEEVGRDGKWQLRYSGRKGSGTTAEGSVKAHKAEQSRIIEEAVGNASGWQPKIVPRKA